MVRAVDVPMDHLEGRIIPRRQSANDKSCLDNKSTLVADREYPEAVLRGGIGARPLPSPLTWGRHRAPHCPLPRNEISVEYN